MMNSKPAISYVSQLFILFGLMAGAFLLSGLAAILIWQGMVGDVLSMEKGMLNPANAEAVKLIQLVSSAIMFLLPAFVFARIVNHNPLRYLGFKTRFNWAQFGLTVVIVFVAFALSGALGEFTNLIPIQEKWEQRFRAWEKLYADQVLIIANMKSTSDYLYTLLVIAIAPAIFEELLFRGVVQQFLVKWTNIAWLGILLTSLFFSAVHFSYYGFLARASLGIVLGYMFYYSKSLWLPIIAHFINNGFAVTAMYVLNKQGKLTEKALDERFPIWYGVIALGIIITLMIILKNESKKLGTYYLDNTATKSDNPFENNFDFEKRQV